MKKQATKHGENDSHSPINRRAFIGKVSTAAAAFTIVPSHVLGGGRYVAPSDKINVAYIGMGTQGLRQLPGVIRIPDVQITSVCDPQKKAIGYLDWDAFSLRKSMRELIGNPGWETGGDNTIPGGLENGKEIVEAYYSKQNGKKFTGVAAYADIRELLLKEKPDVLNVMTTDHVHGVIALAALKKGIAVSMHKPVANRLIEGHNVIDQAIKSEAVTHLMPWDYNGDMSQIMQWISEGRIGELKEIHNWSFRPVWPQYPKIPGDNIPVPEGFDWDLWLGPEKYRPYHPHYTNMVFRGWYDFGGGSMADMGHYSLWTVFRALKLEGPEVIEPNLSRLCELNEDGTAYKIHNDYSFPYASTVRFKYPQTTERPAVDLVWYDGGMRPPVPEEFYREKKEFPSEGMMFVGTEGKIMTSGFRVEEPYLLSGKVKESEEVSAAEGNQKMTGAQRFIEGVKSGKQIEGNFRQARGITEAVNLYAAALRANKILYFDPLKKKFTNDSEANTYLTREYRKGWGPDEF